MNFNKKMTVLKENIRIVKQKDFNELMRLKKVIDYLNNHICRGEVTIIDKDNNLVIQTHYEYFRVCLTEQWMMIKRYDIENECEIEKEYTNLEMAYISEYNMIENGVQFIGELDGGYKLSMLCVVKEKMKLNN